MASEPKQVNDADSITREALEREIAALRLALRNARDRLITAAATSETLVKQVSEEAGWTVARTEQELNSKIDQLSTLLAAREEELSQIKRSFGWRLLSHYGTFKYSVLRPLLVTLKLKRDTGEPGLSSAGSVQEGASSEDVITQESKPAAWHTFATGSKDEYSLKVEPVRERAPLEPHTKTVEIVVCVHDALEEVRTCLDSILRNTRMPYSLTIVDDGSGEETAGYLKEFCESQGANLIRNERALGYTRAANQGLKQAKSDYVVLLNSDTVVTPVWLDRLVACAEAGDKIGMASPLSNKASWQSVPVVFGEGIEWADNRLLDGDSPTDAARSLAAYSSRLYPTMPFLNGFCLLIRRELIEDIGLFDEERFGDGYGEENDYCVRARQAGWDLALADDAYVYHHETRSYTSDRKIELSKRADDLLLAKHGAEKVHPGVFYCQYDRVLHGIRARAGVIREREQFIRDGKSRWEGKRILFVLPIAEANGGGNVVFSEARAMRRMGVDVRIVNLEFNRKGFQREYPGVDFPIYFVDRGEDIADLAPEFDIVVATFHNSVYWLDYGSPESPKVKRAYYIQDFEPYFDPFHSQGYNHALNSYKAYDDLIRIVKSEWNRRTIRDHTGADSAVNGPTVDIDLYRPRARKQQDDSDRVRILAMIRPSTPRRAPLFTLQVLSDIYRDRGDRVQIILFGCEPDDKYFRSILEVLPRRFPFYHAGILTSAETAALMNEVDIFVDLSVHQALGLTAMEAIASGVAVIAPVEGGASSFITHGKNGLLADTGSRQACVEAINSLYVDPAFRDELRLRAIYDICRFHPERSAFRMLEVLFEDPSQVNR